MFLKYSKTLKYFKCLFYIVDSSIYKRYYKLAYLIAGVYILLSSYVFYQVYIYDATQGIVAYLILALFVISALFLFRSIPVYRYSVLDKDELQVKVYENGEEIYYMNENRKSDGIMFTLGLISGFLLMPATLEYTLLYSEFSSYSAKPVISVSIVFVISYLLFTMFLISLSVKKFRIYKAENINE